MTSAWTHQQLQHAIHEEVAAVVYAETHGRSRGPAADQGPTAQQHARQGPAAADVPTIVVGVDRSPASDTAVSWAASEAVRRGGRLVLVRAEVPSARPRPVSSLDEEHHLTALTAAVRAAHPRLVDVSSELVIGTAGPALVARAADADLLVVGTHGRGPVSRAVLGSASAYCAVHAHVPTVIVPAEWSARPRPER